MIASASRGTTRAYIAVGLPAGPTSTSGVWWHMPTHPTGFTTAGAPISVTARSSACRTSTLPPAMQHDPDPMRTSARPRPCAGSSPWRCPTNPSRSSRRKSCSALGTESGVRWP